MTEKENVLKFMQYIEKLAKVYEFNIPYRSYDIYAFAKDLLAWLEKQRDKDKLIQELGEYKVKYTQEVLEKYINSMSNKDDERLRKTAIAFLKDFAEQGYENAVECIDWLEKQGEQAPSQTNERAWLYLVSDVLTWKDGIGQYLDDPRVQELAKKLCSEYSQKLYSPSNTLKGEQKSVDKIKPEFKVGDWITFYGSNPFKILKIEADINGVLEYLLLGQNGHDFYFNNTYVDKNVRLWTIQDAKDGDVLATSAGAFIYNGNNCGGSYPGSYCGINNLGNFQTGVEYHWTRKKVYPATKEQRDLLFQKMKEAGYEWDADKKELKKLVPNRFDPKTLQPFDKVLVRDYSTEKWTTGHFSYIEYDLTDTDLRSCDEKFKFLVYTSGLSSYWCAVPYNDETKHLVGTTEEVPEYYRYWED